MKKEKIKFETLHKGFNFKVAFYALVIFALIGSVIILKGSKANYTYQEIIPFAEGTVRIRKTELKIMEIHKQKTKGCTATTTTCYEKTTTLPTSGYKLNTTNSYCTKDNGTTDVRDTDIVIEYKDGKVTVNKVKKGTRCYIYLDIQESARDQILAKATKGTGTPDFGLTSCASECYEATNGLYSAQDDDGTTWYFRGTVDDNWVKFGKVGNDDIYWRIIRINGDGSIRMIYSGVGSPQTTGTGTQLSSTSNFNNFYDNISYVGFMYTKDNLHGLEEDSTIKRRLDEWYKANLIDKATYLSDSAGFCGDRTSTEEPGVGSSWPDYAAYNRLYTNKTPTFKCSDSLDLYTTSKSSKGNKALTYPIGLITADEVVYAGGRYERQNNQYYLEGSDYWTMSPCGSVNAIASVFFVSPFQGLLAKYRVDYSRGVRPVINLKEDVTLSGNGTTTSPYEVVGSS